MVKLGDKGPPSSSIYIKKEKDKIADPSWSWAIGSLKIEYLINKICKALTTKVEVKPPKSAVWQKEKSLRSTQNRVAFNVGLLLSKTLIS